ncbi:hypothetical protein HPB49_021870 [Dermacentor silvarum]|uniref:Uncharacterized protein n=1 Tax=Dermacentor silvarum TaxID=543639 RepID=A0ACB8D078_DERSI|nr:hypothetical protein HPB49_021870 [Dermacentor silvarum]
MRYEVALSWKSHVGLVDNKVGSYQSERRGPVFVHEPPRRVDFSNSTGATVACSATGSPEPRVTWTSADGTPMEDVRGLRYARPNGSLVLPPFRAEDYRQDVHATVYRCAASNPVGAIVSRDVQVRAVSTLLSELSVAYEEQNLLTQLECSRGRPKAGITPPRHLRGSSSDH